MNYQNKYIKYKQKYLNLQYNIKGSMIPNDPIGIFEQLWDKF